MKVFIFKSSIYLLFFAFIRILPNIIFDNYIFFRFWEYAHVNQETPKLPRFAPNLNTSIIEEGDLNHGLNCSEPKTIYWFTDKYGFRNKKNIKQADYLFVGCSNVLGSNCNYINTFSGILNKKFNVYQIAPDYNLNFFQKIFREEKPEKLKHIYVVQVARYFTHENQFAYEEINFDKSINLNSLYIERIKRNYFGNKIISQFKKSNSHKCEEEFHYYGTNPKTEFIERNISNLKSRLILFNVPYTIIVIPDKEFYRKDDTLNKEAYYKIINELKKSKMPFIEIASHFDKYCYFHGDGHINENAHKKIALFIEREINSSKSNQTHQGSN